MPIEQQMKFGNAASQRRRMTEQVLHQAAIPKKGKRRVKVSTGLNRRSTR